MAGSISEWTISARIKKRSRMVWVVELAPVYKGGFAARGSTRLGGATPHLEGPRAHRVEGQG